jgi:hypothetical protein
MRLLRILSIAFGVMLAGCTTNAPPAAPLATVSPAGPTTPGQPTPVPMVPGASQGTVPAGSPAFALRESPPDLGCDAIGIEYTTITFRIDPTASEPVTAITDTGVSLQTHWAAGFRAGTADERVIRDPNGQVVAKDGDVVPASGQLGGYFMCLGPESLFVLLQAPQ